MSGYHGYYGARKSLPKRVFGKVLKLCGFQTLHILAWINLLALCTIVFLLFNVSLGNLPVFSNDLYSGIRVVDVLGALVFIRCLWNYKVDL